MNTQEEDQTKIRCRKARGFTTIKNGLLQDRRLSSDCLACLVAILSRPDNWKINISWLQKERGIGRNRAYAALSEAVESGYCIKRRERLPNGQLGPVEYVITDDEGSLLEPLPDFREVVAAPLPENHFPVQPLPENRDHTKEPKITNQHNTKSPKPPKGALEIVPSDPDGPFIQEDGKLILGRRLESYWLPRFEQDADRLELAVIEVAGIVQPNSSRPLEAQISLQLSRILGRKRDADKRYQRTVEQRGERSIHWMDQ